MPSLEALKAGEKDRATGGRERWRDRRLWVEGGRRGSGISERTHQTGSTKVQQPPDSITSDFLLSA